MDTNENIRNDTSEELIELGAISAETKGPGFTIEFVGMGDPTSAGIADE